MFGWHTIQRYQEYVNLRNFRAQVGAELDPRVVATATQARAQQLAPEERAAKEKADLTVKSAIFDAHESIVEREVVEDLIDALTVRWFEPPQKLKLSPLAPVRFPTSKLIMTAFIVHQLILLNGESGLILCLRLDYRCDATPKPTVSCCFRTV